MLHYVITFYGHFNIFSCCNALAYLRVCVYIYIYIISSPPIGPSQPDSLGVGSNSPHHTLLHTLPAPHKKSTRRRWRRRDDDAPGRHIYIWQGLPAWCLHVVAAVFFPSRVRKILPPLVFFPISVLFVDVNFGHVY